MNESLLILADYLPENLSNIQTIGLQEIDLEKLFKSTQNLVNPVTYLYIQKNIDKFFKTLMDKIRVIKAAGGLVKNGDGNYLFIFRLGRWDLPKGKLEENEKTKIAAKREVEEECGIKVDYLGQKLCNTYHTYYMRGRFVLKQTSWYEMGVNKCPSLTPQTEEDIEAAEWLSPSGLTKVRSNTYPLILDVLQSI